MIYISSSCVKNKKIKDSVLELVRNGFRNIELSGGTEHYNGLDDDLLELKDKYDLNYLCHNYFPPPKEHFVLNLASLNNEVYERTFDHLTQTIDLSKRLGAKKFGLHAGFFIDINVNEIGRKISKNNLFDKNESINKFCDGFLALKKNADDVELYIENNVFSSTNAKTYNNNNFFMLSCVEEYKELQQKIDFKLLLDIGHLKVSTHTLDIPFKEQLAYLLKDSDYVHISDNDALHDLNNKLVSDSLLVASLRQQDLKEKDFTLEVYDNINEIKRTFDILQGIIE